MPDSTDVRIPPEVLHDPERKPYLIVTSVGDQIALISIRSSVVEVSGTEELATVLRFTQRDVIDLIRSLQVSYVGKWGVSEPPPTADDEAE